MWGNLGKQAIPISAAKQLFFSANPTGSLRSPSIFDLGDLISSKAKTWYDERLSTVSLTGIINKAFLVPFILCL